MAATRKTSDSSTGRRRPPATTPEARENQLVSAAFDLAEKQLIDGSASPSVIVHLLKLGDSRAKLDLERLKNENLLLEARAKTIETSASSEEMARQAIEAFRAYSGTASAADVDYDF